MSSGMPFGTSWTAKRSAATEELKWIAGNGARIKIRLIEDYFPNRFSLATQYCMASFTAVSGGVGSKPSSVRALEISKS